MVDHAQGDLLIAPPSMPDPRFKEAVLLVTQDTAHGTQALCLNKLSGHSVNEILEPLNIRFEEDLPLYWGGPVGTSTVWLLHSSEWAEGNTQYINSDWSITSSINMFHKLINGDCPKHWRVMVGMASWATGQLDMEMEGEGPWDLSNSWLICAAPTPEEILTKSSSRLWRWSCDQSSHQAVDSWL